MNDKFNEQKDILVSIKKEISLLHQQVDYLIRNEKPLELLDLDVMMNRTHTIYDMMCGVDLGVAQEAYESDEDEELPVEPEVIRSVFGIEEEPAEETPTEEVPVEEEKDVKEEPAREETVEEEQLVEEEAVVEEEKPVEEPVVEEQEPLIEEEELVEENEDAYFEEEADDEEPVLEKNDSSSDDFGFILNFEPITEPEPITQPEPMPKPEPEPEPAPAPAPEPIASSYAPGDEIEMTIPHLDAPVETEYEIETLGDRLQQEQEPTLADKLQNNSVRSLQSAIGINDKFLFVNELFNGSMEKYNRSIENLDDLKTLNGALIYLNELRIELQWNSSNEAYKRLLELVHRKFES